MLVYVKGSDVRLGDRLVAGLGVVRAMVKAPGKAPAAAIAPDGKLAKWVDLDPGRYYGLYRKGGAN